MTLAVDFQPLPEGYCFTSDTPLTHTCPLPQPLKAYCQSPYCEIAVSRKTQPPWTSLAYTIPHPHTLATPIWYPFSKKTFHRTTFSSKNNERKAQERNCVSLSPPPTPVPRDGEMFRNQVRLKSFKLTRSILDGPISDEAQPNITQFRRGLSLSSLLVPSPIITIYK